MIVRQDGFTFQSGHAVLARDLVAALEPKFPALDWPDLKLATLHHDHGWIPYDLSAPLRDEKLVNFLKIDLDDAIHVCRRSIDTAFTLSARCGILVSEHMEYLYGGKNHQGLKQDAIRWAARREAVMTELGLDEAWLKRHYQFVMWADTLSLLLVCDPSEFTRVLRLRLEGEEQVLKSLGDDAYQLSPWPFSKPTLECSFEVHPFPDAPLSEWGDSLGQGTPRLNRITLYQ